MNQSKGTSSVPPKDTQNQHRASEKPSPAEFAGMIVELVQRARESFDAKVAEASAEFDREMWRIVDEVQRASAGKQVEDAEVRR